jgi:TM2 domain-containing membrane protein YozV
VAEKEKSKIRATNFFGERGAGLLLLLVLLLILFLILLLLLIYFCERIRSQLAEIAEGDRSASERDFATQLLGLAER